MTELSSGEVPITGSERLQDALIAFTGCIGSAVPDICSYGITVGEAYVPFNPDPEDECDDDAVICSQIWVRVTGVSPEASESWSGDCAVVLNIGLEVGVLRCLGIPEEGEAPTASEVLVAAMQSMEDMQAIHCAAMGCEVWDSITSGNWLPSGPLGGQYGGVWNFTVSL